MRVAVTAANHIVSVRNLKVEDVSFISTNTIGYRLDKLFSIPLLPAPFGQQIRCKVTSINVVFRFELVCFFEQSACFRYGPALIYRYPLHCDIPFGAFGGERGSFFENSLGLSRTFLK